ncbi:hypothetical protein [Streptomyces sp. NEAU-L66]|uniref:hypothetical protein n=1 Tax=Streptomyces sp. NEAU-L66 TaxID=3390812 RepID=UPI0039C66853
MDSLLDKVNADDKLRATPITATEWTAESVTGPVLSTPVTVTTVVGITATPTVTATPNLVGGVAPTPRNKG